jgi:hypothetical protein
MLRLLTVKPTKRGDLAADADVTCLGCGSSYRLVRAEDSITEATNCPSCAYAGWKLVDRRCSSRPDDA